MDKIVTPRQTTYMPGGTSYYFSHGISCLKDAGSYELVTALAESEMSAVEEIRKKGIAVKVLPSRFSVYFENVYGENQDNRTQRVLAKADPFTADGLRDVEANIYHLGSLLADDFSLDVIKYLSGKGILSVDAQGYLREVRGEDVYPVDWTEKRDQDLLQGRKIMGHFQIQLIQPGLVDVHLILHRIRERILNIRKRVHASFFCGQRIKHILLVLCIRDRCEAFPKYTGKNFILIIGRHIQKNTLRTVLLIGSPVYFEIP